MSGGEQRTREIMRGMVYPLWTRSAAMVCGSLSIFVGHGICVYPSSALLEHNNVESISSKPIDELIKADCFAKAFQGRTFAEYMFLLYLFDRLNNYPCI
jgi:hypothetical protein